MISSEHIKSNKFRFLDLIDSITRSGANISLLRSQLENSDFFSAPASTKYHQAYEGGLCEHSLAVYDNLVKINAAFNYNFDEDSMKIVALLHDFAKMNLYVTEMKNKKVYCEGGKKHDSMGDFDWVSVPGYVTRDANNRFLIGNHEFTSYYMANTFIPLQQDEVAAIMHHHGGMGWDSAQDNIADIFIKFPLAHCLYMADSISAYTPDSES